MKLLHQLWPLPVSVCLGILTSYSSVGLPVMAQQNNAPSSASPSTSTARTELSSRSTLLETVLERFQPPATGAPDSGTVGNGSSREGFRCSMNEPFMQPLLPNERYGLTFAERPEIFVNIPSTSAKEVLLVFRNEADTDHRQVFLPVPETVGMVGFQLPDTIDGLAIGQTYRWSLTFICGHYFTLNDPSITGWVRRVESTPEADQVLAERSPDDQLEWFSENGHWYDLTQQLVTDALREPDAL